MLNRSRAEDSSVCQPVLDPASTSRRRPLIAPVPHPSKDHLGSSLGNKQLKPRAVFSTSCLCWVPIAQLLPLGPKTSCENLIYKTYHSTLCLFDYPSVSDIKFCTPQWQSTYLIIFCSVPSLASGTQLNYAHLCCFKKISKRRTECNLEIIKNTDSGYKQTQIQVLTTLFTGCVIIDEFLSFLDSIFLFLKCNVYLEGLLWEWGCEYVCVCVYLKGMGLSWNLCSSWGVQVQSPVRGLRSHKPKNQNMKRKQYCNKFNKDFKNGPHENKVKGIYMPSLVLGTEQTLYTLTFFS